jgi:hypothetical protein
VDGELVADLAGQVGPRLVGELLEQLFHPAVVLFQNADGIRHCGPPSAKSGRSWCGGRSRRSGTDRVRSTDRRALTKGQMALRHEGEGALASPVDGLPRADDPTLSLETRQPLV